MAKKAKKAVDYGYTPEQIKEIQEYFKSNDFTKVIFVEHKTTLSGEKAKVYQKAKDIFSKYWLNNLKGIGIKRMMKNFSREYPIKLLQSADGDFFTEEIAEMYTDTEQFDKAVEQFLEMYEDQIYAGLDAYCQSFGKKAEDLTDEEIGFVVEKVSDVLNEELIKVMMLGQQVPEVYETTRKIRTHEDFSKAIEGNYDLINFHNKWTHCKTKLGAPLFFSELSLNEATGIEGARNFFASADQHTQKEYEEIRDIFADSLNSTDREIYYMREQGYTLAEIACRLGYKTHSAISKRLKAIFEKYNEFCGYVEANQKEKKKK
ncbi:MAG: helix-turn-helix domain-containing protein [Clostridiales bacterium]|nr:helix-turn-helix domain-containing protein [Clostridiales bacterium]